MQAPSLLRQFVLGVFVVLDELLVMRETAQQMRIEKHKRAFLTAHHLRHASFAAHSSVLPPEATSTGTGSLSRVSAADQGAGRKDGPRDRHMSQL